ncbi:TonB-dependent receptor [Algoriphagus machipongonensis]|uniref:TonB-dependent receptor n=1 Tax=Algoriphagus machipongonensis TaxID=388413 RepID=A3HWF2_9BACT|nr:TonB-dependent receptor [Algoriphagus machipongonensis]EAZ80925.1 TonB-dependent receptor [Algoriphagus machipongonensis]
MLKYLLVGILLFASNCVFSQTTYKAKIIDKDSGTPLVGATILVKEISLGAVSDENGIVTIQEIPAGNYTLDIRFLGYETQKVNRTFPLETSDKPEVFYLEHAHEEMEVLVVRSNRSSRVIEDVPTRVEIIAGEELSEKGNMKPGDIRMLLNESTGIQTQQTSATSYNSSIRIQGLDGKYTQLLRDGLPLYAGYSSGLSLMQIAPLDLAQVEVIKGASSTLYGGGAIAGLVNLISKTPEDKPELSIMLNGTSALGLDASAYYAAKKGKIGTTIFTSYNKGTAYDPAEIGLTAIPKFDRFTINPKLFWYMNSQSSLVLGLNLMQEDRLGGNIDFIEGESMINPYFEKNTTDRISTSLNYQNQLSETSQLTVKNSLSFYDRSIEVPDFLFSGKQFSSFSEVNINTQGENSEWIGGLNLWTDQFTQKEGNEALPLDYTLNTYGVFIQNLWNVSEQWTLESGFRLDYQKDYGAFPLPKISAMFKPSDALTFRLGGGLGYKSPTVFTEDAERNQFQNILPIDPKLFEAEKSAGTNLDINYKVAIGDELSLVANTLFFYTRIQNPLLLTPAGSNYEFQQPQGSLETQGVEVNMKWNYKDFKLFVGYTFADVQQQYNDIKSTYPLVAKHRINNVLMYEKHENFWIGLEAYYFSPQQLNDGKSGKSYWIVGLMSEKKFGEKFSIFLNFENFLDTRQTRFDTIYTGSLSNPEFRDIYAPVDGFVINGGIKFRLL